MVKLQFDIPPEENQILNLYKAQHSLKSKSLAIIQIIREYKKWEVKNG